MKTVACSSNSAQIFFIIDRDTFLCSNIYMYKLLIKKQLWNDCKMHIFSPWKIYYGTIDSKINTNAIGTYVGIFFEHLSLSIYLSNRSIYLSIFIFLSFFLSFFLSVCLSVCLSFFLFFCCLIFKTSLFN